MADMLTIGSQAANTYKQALDVTSHNVANVSTEGYSRQRAEISSNTPSLIGASFNGGGSTVDSILRIQSDYIQTQLNSSNSAVERYDQQLSLATQVEGVIASNDEGVQEFMQRFFDGLQNVANNPTSQTSRQMLLDEAGNLETHIGNLASVLDDTEEQINSQISGLMTEINDRLDTIQQINEEVERALNTGTQPPNDLLDQRDQAILELSGYIDIKTFPQEDGGLDIFTSPGNLPLLADNHKTYIMADLSPYQDDRRMEIYMSIGGQKQMISDRISGGQLGAVLDVRENLLDQAQNELGLTLNGFVAAINWQHYQGYDLEGDAGGDFFQSLSATAMSAKGNIEDGSGITVTFNPDTTALTGLNGTPPYTAATQPDTYGEKEAYLQQALSEIGQMQARDYEIRANGTGYEFFDYKTGAQITPDAVNGDVYKVDGLEFDFSGQTNNDGDKFLVKPHQEMLEQFTTILQNPNDVAARGQSPVDTGVAGLDDETPAPAAYGDNVNMANMASFASQKILLSDENGEATLNILGGYSSMASNVGMYVRGTEIQLTAQQNVYNQIMNQRESLSGVSLDEEAANLIRFQQAYEASAQIISTSQSIFQTLLSVVRG
ncbi:flagellar hook-associated protein FlgK [Thiomicrorhabdus xiamenensis]|uniref:Flagellar hook-associated protein 1 n=1 Tax=Thiomicrorhabdus xiamenensis TaxID=2739063 RepID=A0A7D4NZ52_9GAMM|nr:flagellar hook-associated protein FlgK [Thiomicrorhabdus xiamenensis]QKI89578.1 flagellar hook-associated protein FlgK [Thiomicrorhabdus xiamenensis]